jgi:hypothetical protein
MPFNAQPLRGAIISNSIEGLDQLYRSDHRIQYDILEITADFQPDLSAYQVLIAPNGTDHVALYRMRDRIHKFLDRGGALLCCDGWFTDWVPGNRWVMDNSRKTIDVRYTLREDPFGVEEQFNIQDLNFSHGISGWWACGYIEAAPGATVLIEDTWQRPLVVVDEVTTNGIMVLSASGPLADLSYATTDDSKAYEAMSNLYKALLNVILQNTPKEQVV